MRMNILDKVVMALSPKLGRDRLMARMQAENLLRVTMRYDGASAARNASYGWRSVGTDANAEIRSQNYKLREIARDMVRNNPYAARGVQVISEGVIGAGIIPNVEARTPEAKKRINDLIKDHCDSVAIDVDGRNNLYGLQSLAMRSVVEAGAVLIRRRPRRAEDGLPLPFQLQVLEIDHLDTRKDGSLPGGGFIFDGIQFDAKGHRRGYHLFREHPGNVATYRLPESDFVPAEDVIHLYRMDRPGQMSGVTWFAPVMLPMRDYADYEEAQLMRQKIAACFSAFFTRTDGGQNLLLGNKEDPSKDTGLPAEGIEPGMIMRLRDGESVTFGVPPQVEGYRDFSVVTLHKIAVGLGVDYASLTGDNSQGNFANSRMGWLRYHRSVENWQWNMAIPNMCDPIGRWLLDGAALVSGRRVPARVLWTPPRREMFDPSKDVKAAIEAVRGGLSSRSAEVRKLGFDPEDLDAEIKADNDRSDTNGFTFSSDSRYPVNGIQESRDGEQTG